MNLNRRKKKRRQRGHRKSWR